MSYTDQTRRASPAGMAAVIGVHAGMGLLLVAGLTVGGVIPRPETPLTALQLDPPKPPPPPQTESVPPDTSIVPAPPDTMIVVPVPPVMVNPLPVPVQSSPVPVPTTSAGATGGLAGTAIKPVAARPGNDPGRWITVSDYRPSWIRRDMAGNASFRLTISKTGQVEACHITRSTGHSQLDEATCRLIARRARFEPARGTGGEPVTGHYSGSIRWQLPE